MIAATYLPEKRHKKLEQVDKNLASNQEAKG